MAFVSIGLETSLGSLVSTDGGRPAIAFLGGQAFNIIVTFSQPTSSSVASRSHRKGKSTRVPLPPPRDG